MLGDTGSNLLGALAGLWLVSSLDAVGELAALAALVALTAYGELRSISQTIEGIAPLRALDRLGRRPDDAAPEDGPVTAATRSDGRDPSA